ncbi:hypothetical protein [Phyllobacterium salinisoli]
MSLIKVAVAAITLTLAAAGLASAQERACRSTDPVDTIKEMFVAIFACWEPPVGSDGMSMTLTFSIRRDGTLIGKPRTSYSQLGPDDGLNKAFVASVFEALDKALPLPLSDSMGGAIAGRMLAPRFTATRESPT